MRAGTGKRPVENPEEDNEDNAKPTVKRKIEFFVFDVFDLGLNCHALSVP